MKAVAKIQKPEDLILTVETSMTVRQWRELKTQLSSNYPSWKFGALLRDVIDRAIAQVESPHESED